MIVCRHSPRQFGVRFSANALAPSRASADANTGAVTRFWRSNNSPLVQSALSCITRLLAAIASGPLPAICFASASAARSEEHTSELQSLMRISYAVFCLNKKNQLLQYTQHTYLTIS